MFEIKLSDQNVIASANKTVMCAGENTTLTALGAGSYSWTGGATASVVIVKPLVTTTFVATSTDPQGCANSAKVTVQVNACTGLQASVTEQELSVFPNPANGVFYVDGSSLGGARLHVVNSLGQNVAEIDLSEKELPLEVSLPRGIYFYSLVKENTVTKSGKIIVH